MIQFSHLVSYKQNSPHCTCIPCKNKPRARQFPGDKRTFRYSNKESGFALVLEGRKPAARLDISGTPGVEQLRPMEREVCKNYAIDQNPNVKRKK